MPISLSADTLRLLDGKDPGEDRPGAVRVVVRIAVHKATGPAA
ncbi:MAG TPA: hypothetical protein VN695_03570 [Streptosporangiaceae bacterium]|nr:hypothetical protein [Streptosporangiaceae bacterium]